MTIFNLDKKRAQKTHEEAQSLNAAGLEDQAIEKYKEAIALDLGKSESYYNIGLIYKYRNDWKQSFEFNKKAYEIDSEDEAARWNFAIAATALRDWKTARRLWKDNGIELDDKEGAINLDFGITPVRLNADSNGEVVWARRIDPVRAKIDNIPLPESGFCRADIVLHDGAAVGYRMHGEHECPVFNVLELFDISELSTFMLLINLPEKLDVESLSNAFDGAGIEMEDWTSNVQMLCKACSEGVPHSDHDRENNDVWVSERKIGVAAASKEEIEKILHHWFLDTQNNTQNVYTLTCELSATDRLELRD